MVLESTFFGGVTGAALSSLLTAGRVVPVFGEVVPDRPSPHTSIYHLYLSMYHMHTYSSTRY